MKSIRSLAAVLLLSFPAAAIAQQPAKQSAPAQQPPSAQAAQSSPRRSQDWQQTEKADTSNGAKYTQFTLAGKFIKRPGQGGPDRPTLAVNCGTGGRLRAGARKLISATLQVGFPLKIDYVEPLQQTTGTSYYPKVDVRYGLDDGKTEKEQWSAGADKASATFQKETLKKILHSRTVIVALQTDAESEISAQFDLPDSTQVAQSCGINLRKK